MFDVGALEKGFLRKRVVLWGANVQFILEVTRLSLYSGNDV